MTLTETEKGDSCCGSAAEVSDSFIVQQVGTQQVLCMSDLNDPMNARETRIELLKAFKANVFRFSCKLKSTRIVGKASR